MKTATSETLIENTVKAISRAPRRAASQRRGSLLQMPGDVLDHDDGVVDDEAGGDREGHQRQVVDAVAQEVHRAERADERDGHDDARDQGRAQAPQEDEDDEDDERDRDRERHLDVVNRGADGGRAVDDPGEPDRRRQVLLQLRQECLDPVDRRDDVRPGLPEDDDDDGRLSVGDTARRARPRRSRRPSRRRPGAARRRRGRTGREAGTPRPSGAGRSAPIAQARSPAPICPLGRLALAEARNPRTSSSESPALFRAVGLTSTRTAGRAPPPTNTRPTPSTCAIFCCRIEEATS